MADGYLKHEKSMHGSRDSFSSVTDVSLYTSHGVSISGGAPRALGSELRRIISSMASYLGPSSLGGVRGVGTLVPVAI